MSPRIRVMLADDHEAVRQGLRALFAAVPEVEIVKEVGDVEAAGKVLEDVRKEVGERRGVLVGLIRMCEGDHAGAAQGLESGGAERGARNNLAVTHFYEGNIERCLQLLHQAIGEGDVPEGVVFNLATCYELLTERNVKQRKEELLVSVRGQADEGGSTLGPSDFKHGFMDR